MSEPDAFSLEAAPDPFVGKVLQERYRVLRKLGEGGMGAVYEGEHLIIKKRVAIKVLHAQWATSAEIVSRFHQEAVAATAIGHEHIVEVNDMGRTPEGALFMVLELLAGRDFASLLEQEGPMSIGRAAHVVAQVCDALAAAHAKGIVHRDLKPENVFLIKRSGDPDFVKVLDFGISKIRDDLLTHRAETRTGAVMGTALYMSPEQAQGRKTLDHRTDVWAIGVILFRSLSGRYPFEDEAYPMLVLKICTEQPLSLRHFRPDLPEGLVALVEQCLEKPVERRVQSCDELAERLRPFAQASPAAGRAGATPTPVPVTPRGGPDALAETAPSDPERPSRVLAVELPEQSFPDESPRRSAGWKLPAVIVAVVLLAGAAIAAVSMGGGDDTQPELDPTALPAAPAGNGITATPAVPPAEPPRGVDPNLVAPSPPPGAPAGDPSRIAKQPRTARGDRRGTTDAVAGTPAGATTATAPVTTHHAGSETTTAASPTRPPEQPRDPAPPSGGSTTTAVTSPPGTSGTSTAEAGEETPNPRLGKLGRGGVRTIP